MNVRTGEQIQAETLARLQRITAASGHAPDSETQSRVGVEIRDHVIEHLEAALRTALAERDEARKDALYHHDCRPNRRQAEAYRDDAKAMNDKWADEVKARPMIRIHKSQTADTRTCDFANVSKETLLASSKQHIGDVRQALVFFINRLTLAGQCHDPDKLTDIDGFHADFVTGFKQTGWWDRHRKLNRHHLNMEDGIPPDVNLIDVLDFIADCVMAGMARSGSVYPLHLTPDLLERAFQNTVELLKLEIVVEESGT